MQEAKREAVAVIPAGGLGQRTKQCQTWKELIPLGYKSIKRENSGEFKVPKVISEYIIENIKSAGVSNVFIVINNQKTELMRFFGDGSLYGVNMAYLIQDLSKNIYAMPVALDIAYPYVKDKDILFGMPDTIVRPDNSFDELYKYYIKEDLDLALGVFPTTNTKELAPVTMGENGMILDIKDKPKKSNILNTWNIAVWSPRFTQHLHEMVEEYIKDERYRDGELLMSKVFLEAAKKGLKSKGFIFNSGMCYDIASTNKLYDFLINEVYKAN